MNDIFSKLSFMLILIALPAMSDMPYVETKQLFSLSDVVIVGEMVGFQELKFTSEAHAHRVAIVKISRVKKGNINSNFVLVSYGYVWPDNLKSSQDFDLPLKQMGTWLIQKKQSGLYSLDRPERFIVLE
jgi:hypothetical protein